MPKVDERVGTETRPDRKLASPLVWSAKLKQLKTQQQRKEARARSIATKRTRAQELRRKILAGAVLTDASPCGHVSLIKSPSRGRVLDARNVTDSSVL